MRTSRHTRFLIALLAAALLAGATSAWAGGPRHHGHHHPHRGVSWGLGIGYPAPGWPAYGPAYAYYPPPGYGPGYAGSIGIGYGSGGHRGGWGFALTLPLYLGPRYAPPPPAVVAPARQAAARQPGADCLQVREYQTRIVIGGRSVPAYGDACLQPDGSWVQVTGPFAADY